MGYKPPKGVSPPHLDGKRTGRPKGTQTHARVWADVAWANDHLYDQVPAPNPNAWLWRTFGRLYPDELYGFLCTFGRDG